MELLSEFQPVFFVRVRACNLGLVPSIITHIDHEVLPTGVVGVHRCSPFEMRSGPKSHLGCRQCKKRKVKCDEKTPACSACIRRREACSYLDVTQQHASHVKASTASAASEQRSQCPPEPSWYTPTLDIDLTHYYLMHTCRTIMFDPRRRSFWREIIFPLSFDSTAPDEPDLTVLHGHLATAALHKIAVANPSPSLQERYIACAADRQSKAVSTLIRMLDAPSPKNAPALFTLSVLVTIWAFASRSLPAELNTISISRLALRDGHEPHPEAQHACQHDGKASPPTLVPHRWHLENLVTIIHVTQGIRAITLGCSAWLRDLSPEFSHMMTMPGPPGPATPDSLAALLALEAHVRATQPARDVEMYITEIRRVEVMLALQLDAETRESLLGWLAGLDQAYVRVLAAGEQAALAILAFWAGTFYTMDDRWWARGWAVGLVEEVYAAVDEKWRVYLEWPLGAIGRLELREIT
ncbi:hypothetical protein EJ05DRAFT_482568 [Pseudovirgaria hyperparasitica]|uniref:Zn(2)-C6 fungal-type domain-containing protein n=1 Tax=Pseudovirgaria hyperparasitica TaxID=470096 RepID=A0A6A6WHZ8_9PEZI|nr:uncharacterized protein EJ05DRAFT_482568 [Pseudovirgaria hyperparasitica]KAF2761725.1 hypothetical protein EJ05DRAFT_482568 [Pseudovirgaria hyperparasitica]